MNCNGAASGASDPTTACSRRAAIVCGSAAWASPFLLSRERRATSVSEFAAEHGHISAP
jgi:hypothetical protein